MKSIILSEKEYSVKMLGLEDEGLLQRLCEKCTDYYEIVEGRLPEKTAAHEILTDLPPNRSLDDKFVYGCFNAAGLLIAVIDVVRDYPEQGEWIIGLMMIDPAERGKGLGKTLNNFVKDAALSFGASKLRIGVAEDNKNALGFWSSLGYRELKRANARYGNKDNVIVVMNLEI